MSFTLFAQWRSRLLGRYNSAQHSRQGACSFAVDSDVGAETPGALTVWTHSIKSTTGRILALQVLVKHQLQFWQVMLAASRRRLTQCIARHSGIFCNSVGFLQGLLFYELVYTLELWVLWSVQGSYKVYFLRMREWNKDVCSLHNFSTPAWTMY